MNNLKITTGELESGQFFVTTIYDNISLEQFLDTGSTFTSVPWNLFSKYQQTGTLKSKGLANTAQQHDKITVQQAFLSNSEKANIEVIRLTKSSSMAPTLGINFFQNSKFIFSPSTNELSFEDFTWTHKEDLKIGNRGHILLNVMIENKEYSAIWDTGAGLTTIDQKLVAENPDNFTFIQETEGNDCNEGSLKLNLYLAKKLHVGNIVFKDLKVLVHDFESISQALGEQIDLALGFNALILKNWKFDLINKTWSAE